MAQLLRFTIQHYYYYYWDEKKKGTETFDSHLLWSSFLSVVSIIWSFIKSDQNMLSFCARIFVIPLATNSTTLLKTFLFMFISRVSENLSSNSANPDLVVRQSSWHWNSIHSRMKIIEDGLNLMRLHRSYSWVPTAITVSNSFSPENCSALCTSCSVHSIKNVWFVWQQGMSSCCTAHEKAMCLNRDMQHHTKEE